MTVIRTVVAGIVAVCAVLAVLWAMLGIGMARIAFLPSDPIPPPAPDRLVRPTPALEAGESFAFLPASPQKASEHHKHDRVSEIETIVRVDLSGERVPAKQVEEPTAVMLPPAPRSLVPPFPDMRFQPVSEIEKRQMLALLAKPPAPIDLNASRLWEIKRASKLLHIPHESQRFPGAARDRRRQQILEQDASAREPGDSAAP